jgi:hypothetical protein
MNGKNVHYFTTISLETNILANNMKITFHFLPAFHAFFRFCGRLNHSQIVLKLYHVLNICESGLEINFSVKLDLPQM